MGVPPPPGACRKVLDKKFSGCHCEMYHAEYNCGGAAFCARAQQNFGGCNFEFWSTHEGSRAEEGRSAKEGFRGETQCLKGLRMCPSRLGNPQTADNTYG